MSGIGGGGRGEGQSYQKNNLGLTRGGGGTPLIGLNGYV